MYKDRRGEFQPAHLWPRCDQSGNIAVKSSKPAWRFWNGYAVMSAAPTLASFATTQTAQIGSNSISERGHKSYIFIMNKRRAKLGKDRLGGHGPLGIEMVMHRENLKFIHGEQTMEDEQSRMKIVLRSFSIGIEAHFMKQWLQKRPTLTTYEFPTT